MADEEPEHHEPTTADAEKKMYLPRSERRPELVSIEIQDRDRQILRALVRYRVLRVSQVKRLAFPETSLQPVRRRLKLLYHHGYVDRVSPISPSGHGGKEIAYVLGKVGMEFLQAEEPNAVLPRRPARVQLTFLEHALDVAEFQLRVELALKSHPKVQLKRFISDWEMKTRLKGLNGKHRYRLFDQVAFHDRTWVVYPDCLFVLQGRGALESYSRLFFVEIDRGTMGLQRIREKVEGYHLYLKTNAFSKYGGFKSFTVLIQTSSERRAKNMHALLKMVPGHELVWITYHALTNEKTLLLAPIWLDHEGELRQIIRG